MILIFDLARDKKLRLLLLKNGRVRREHTFLLPTKLSEELWKILPKVLLSVKKDKFPKAFVIRYRPGMVTYSSLRTILSIMNAFGVLGGVPLVYISKIFTRDEDLIDEIEKRLFQKKWAYYITPLYSKM